VVDSDEVPENGDEPVVAEPPAAPAG